MKNVIESIYIFDNSGICLTGCSTNPSLMNENLVSGFFTAIRQFGEIVIPGSEIKSLVMSGHKLFYNNYESITICIQSSLEIPNQVIQYILDEISNKFLELYADILPSYGRDVTPFSDFKKFLGKFLEEPLIERILVDFGYNVFAESVILFDERQDKILFAKVPEKFSSQRKISMGGMLINFAKKLSNEFEGGFVNSILISTENKWICVAKQEHIYITVLFPKKKNIELDIIVEKTEETLNNVLKMLKL